MVRMARHKFRTWQGRALLAERGFVERSSELEHAPGRPSDFARLFAAHLLLRR